MKIINLTPHDIVIIDNNKNEVKRFKSKSIARLVLKTEDLVTINGIPITKTTPLRVEGLPKEEKGKMYIVSQWVKNSPLCSNRTDLLVPTEMLRGDNGKVLGCKALGI